MTKELKEEIKKLKAELKEQKAQIKVLTRAKVKSLGFYRSRFNAPNITKQ